MILVTGGTGLVGGAAVEALVRRGKRVAVLSRDAARVGQRFPHLPVALSADAAGTGDAAVVALGGDVRDADSLSKAFRGAEVVVDAVQFPNSPIENRRKGWTFEQVDYKGTLNQIEAAKAAGVQRYVYVSAVGADVHGDRHWFRFKGMAEEAVRQSGLPYVIIRPAWVYGPRDVALNRFVGLARRLPFVPLIGSGEQAMQPLFVDDLGALLADAVERADVGGQTFEAGGPERMSMNEVIRTALDVAELRRPIVHQPVALGKAMAWFLQFLPGPPLTPDAVEFITHEAVADNSALERVFAPRLTPLREGLATYLAPRDQR